SHILPVSPRVLVEITRGRVQQRFRPVRGRLYLIGAATDCELVLGDLTFPETYAYLFVQEARITIRRLGAGPELVVCDEAVEMADLRHGDRVSFGPFELRLAIGGEEEPVRGSRRAGAPQVLPPTARSHFEASPLIILLRR